MQSNLDLLMQTSPINNEQAHLIEALTMANQRISKLNKTLLLLAKIENNQFTEKELCSWGANIIIYANHMLRASYPAMVKVATTILESERSKEADSLCMPIKQILELIPGTK